ncbi:MAG: hypothetical protein JRJ44_09345, partial [Deltaproteobacteria bacterium]|nr:hypothetical protein [Deltaproteobacteria bacterium]
QNTNAQTTENWNLKNYNSDTIQYGNLQLNALNPDNINQFFTPDTLLDAGFISYDLYKILTDNIIGEKHNSSRRRHSRTLHTACYRTRNSD